MSSLHSATPGFSSSRYGEKARTFDRKDSAVRGGRRERKRGRGKKETNYSSIWGDIPDRCVLWVPFPRSVRTHYNCNLSRPLNSTYRLTFALNVSFKEAARRVLWSKSTSQKVCETQLLLFLLCPAVSLVSQSFALIDFI